MTSLLGTHVKIVSNNLYTTYVNHWSVMFASFHSEKALFPLLMTSSFGGIPSTPCDLLSFIFLTFVAIISGVTDNCPK